LWGRRTGSLKRNVQSRFSGDSRRSHSCRRALDDFLRDRQGPRPRAPLGPVLGWETRKETCRRCGAGKIIQVCRGLCLLPLNTSDPSLARYPFSNRTCPSAGVYFCAFGEQVSSGPRPIIQGTDQLPTARADSGGTVGRSTAHILAKRRSQRFDGPGRRFVAGLVIAAPRSWTVGFPPASNSAHASAGFRLIAIQIASAFNLDAACRGTVACFGVRADRVFAGRPARTASRIDVQWCSQFVASTPSRPLHSWSSSAPRHGRRVTSQTG